MNSIEKLEAELKFTSNRITRNTAELEKAVEAVRTAAATYNPHDICVHLPGKISEVAKLQEKLRQDWEHFNFIQYALKADKQ